MNSLSKLDTITKSHRFKVENYSLTKGWGIGYFILSTIFTVGGHEWAIKFYPDGECQAHSDYMSVFLQLQSKSGKPRISCCFSLLDHTTGETAYRMKFEPSCIFNFSFSNWGYTKFMRRDTFEASNCLRQDSLTIICDVTVIKDPISSSVLDPIPVLQSHIHERLSALLSSKKGVDITLEVGGKTFQAHKCVLAASSSVFESEIFGWMKAGKHNIKISDMEAPVFEAMLHFIYNDTLPEIEKHKLTMMMQRLLEAADRYKLKRLKLTCEQQLCNNLDMSDVGDKLALAERYNLTHLRNQCIKFLASPKALSSAIDTEGFKRYLRNHTTVVRDIMYQMIAKTG